MDGHDALERFCRALLLEALIALARPVRVELRRGKEKRITSHPETRRTLAWLRDPDSGLITLNDVSSIWDVDAGYIQRQVEERILAVRRRGIERLRRFGLRCRPRVVRMQRRSKAGKARVVFVEPPGLRERIEMLMAAVKERMPNAERAARDGRRRSKVRIGNPRGRPPVL